MAAKAFGRRIPDSLYRCDPLFRKRIRDYLEAGSVCSVGDQCERKEGSADDRNRGKRKLQVLAGSIKQPEEPRNEGYPNHLCRRT